eukprot:5291800-Prymnesium_polylepis.1
MSRIPLGHERVEAVRDLRRREVLVCRHLLLLVELQQVGTSRYGTDNRPWKNAVEYVGDRWIDAEEEGV